MQKSLRLRSRGRLRTSITLQTSEKFQLHSLLLLPMHQPLLSSPLPPRPLFILLRSSRDLARLVTKSKRLRWLKVRGLARMVLSQRIRAKARRSSPCQRPKVQRLLSSSRLLLPKSRMLLLRQRRLIPNPRKLTNLSPNQAIKQTLLLHPKHSLGSFSFAPFFYTFSLIYIYFFTCNFPWLCQFCQVFMMYPFFLLNKKTSTFTL